MHANSREAWKKGALLGHCGMAKRNMVMISDHRGIDPAIANLAVEIYIQIASLEALLKKPKEQDDGH